MHILLPMALVAAHGQVLVDSAKLPKGFTEFSDRQEETRLSCEVIPMRPSLNYGFRFQAGYIVRIPMQQYLGDGHTWGIVIRVTPEAADAKPVYLVSRVNLPKIPKTNVNFEMGGGYIVGAGKYKVEWMLFDDQSRVCRKSWQIRAQLSRAERAVQMAMPANTVTDLSLRGLPRATIQTDDAKAIRLTVLMHVAPISMRRTTMRSSDRMMLLGSLSTLLEHVPTSSVRLIAFSLEQQKEVYRSERFTRARIDGVANAINQLELGLVDIKVLQNRRGHVELLTEILEHEINAPHPSEVVLFLGPGTRYFDKLPPSSLEPAAKSASRFLFFQLHSQFRGGPPPEAGFPDSIGQIVSRLKGKILHIRTPADFAKGIHQLEARI
jgi:hypothetical protein